MSSPAGNLKPVASKSVHAGAFNCAYLAMIFCLLLLLCRTAFLGVPSVFADEYVYASWSYYARTGNVPEIVTVVHNWLFFLVSSVTHIGGEEHLIEKMRLMNILFCLASVLPLLALARGYLSAHYSILLAGVFSGLGLSGYAAFFMPETIYAFTYVVLLSAALSYFTKPKVLVLLGVAIVHGAMISIKPHALFVLPVFFAILAWYRDHDDYGFKEGIGKRIGLGALYLVVALLCSIFLNTLISGHLIINPFSGIYGEQASSFVEKDYSGMLERVLMIASRHLSTIGVVAALPFLVLGASTFRFLVSGGKGQSRNEAAFAATGAIAFISLILMMGITWLFTASVAGNGLYETLGRMHGRYYEVYLVVGLFISVIISRNEFNSWSKGFRRGIATLAFAIAIISYIQVGKIGWQETHDFAFAFSLFTSHFLRYNMLLVSLMVVVVFLIRPRFSVHAIALSIAIYMGWNAYLVDVRRSSIDAGVIDQYSFIMHKLPVPGPRYTMFSTHDADTYRAAFYMIGRGHMIHVPIGSLPSCEQLPQTAVVLTLNSIGVPCELSPISASGETTLTKGAQ